MAEFSERGNDRTGCIKSGEFIDYQGLFMWELRECVFIYSFVYV